MNQFTNQPHHDRSPGEDPSNDAGDRLESLVAAALAAPPPPSSLMRTIDAAFAAQWGVSPGIAPKNRVRRAFAAVQAVASPLRYAAVAALAVALLVAVLGGSDSSAWAAVVRAMNEAGVVRFAIPGGSRWIDLEHDQWGEVRGNRERKLQWRTGKYWVRTVGSDWTQSDADPRWRSASDEQMALAFLAGQDVVREYPSQLDGLRMVEHNRDAESSMNLIARNAAGESVAMEIQIDRQSKLPLSASFQNTVSQVAPAIAQHDPAVDGVESLALESPALESPALESSAVKGVASAAVGPVGSPLDWLPVESNGVDDRWVELIDRQLETLWRDAGMEPVAPADDIELMRRVYLDLAGRIPTVAEAREYLKDESADRYETLVQRLVAGPDHASHLATVWRNILIPDGVDVDNVGGREAFERWLTERFASGDGYHKIARDLLGAEGRLSTGGPLVFYSALKLDADQLAARTSRAFLGIRLECAQCHDHPFEQWTQDDFWGYAAHFARISRPRGELQTVSTVMRVADIDRGEVMLPETQHIVPPRLPGQSADADDGLNRRARLAQWITAPSNPYFARATANRAWAMMHGRGIVDPVDDFGEMNPAVAPELLDVLASGLISNDFDLPTMFETIALSRSYRLSSRGGDGDQDSPRLRLFGQMNVKPLTAEQLFDCIAVATSPEGTGGGMFTVRRTGNDARQAFLDQFGNTAASMTEYAGGIPQALQLMNGDLIRAATDGGSGGLLASLAAPFFSDDQRIEVLYLATVSRMPTADERQWLQTLIDPAAIEASLSDVLWALVNSAEFTLNH